jgi:hypothetical protein
VLRGAVDSSRHLTQIGHVHLESEGLPAHPFDLLGQIAGRGDVPKAERYVRTGIRKRQRDGPADTPRGARDQSHLAFKTEMWEPVHNPPLPARPLTSIQ